MDKFITLIKENKMVQFGLVLLIGVAIGALFYPTKNIEEKVKSEYQAKLDKQSQEHSKKEQELTDKYVKTAEEKVLMERETTKKIQSLTVQIKDLQAKTKESYYKLVKPDGTIEIRKFKESEINESTKVITSIREEFNEKIKETKELYEKVHRERVTKIKEEFDKKESEYRQIISKYEYEKKTEINPKKYGVEIGYLSNKDYYGHVNIDVFGPVFFGLHTQTNFSNSNSVGAGLGIRF